MAPQSSAERTVYYLYKKSVARPYFVGTSLEVGQERQRARSSLSMCPLFLKTIDPETPGSLPETMRTEGDRAAVAGIRGARLLVPTSSRRKYGRAAGW